MSRRNRIVRLFVLLLTAMLLLSSCTANALETAKKKKNTAAPQVTAAVETPTAVPEPTATPGPMDEAQRIADYIFEHGELPDNFITKKQAQALGWDSMYNYVSDIAPGKSIGGDRNEYRIIYSNDGHVWYTGDHYNTFIELFPTKD